MDRLFTRARRTLKPRLRFSLATLLILIGVIALASATIGNRARAVDLASNAVMSHGGHVMLHRPADWLHREITDHARAVDFATMSVMREGGHVMVQRPACWPEQFGVGAWTERVYAVSFRTWHANGAGELKCSDGPYGWNFGDARLSDIEGFFIFETPGGSKPASCQADDEVLRRLTVVGPDLLVLDLISPRITDAGAAYLSQFSNLRVLLLSSTAVTDEGVNALRNLKYLQTLYLTNTGVTDACLDCLLKLPRLRDLDVRGTKVTFDGIRRIKQASPELFVSPDPDEPVDQEP